MILFQLIFQLSISRLKLILFWYFSFSLDHLLSLIYLFLFLLQFPCFPVCYSILTYFLLVEAKLLLFLNFFLFLMIIDFQQIEIFQQSFMTFYSRLQLVLSEIFIAISFFSLNCFFSSQIFKFLFNLQLEQLKKFSLELIVIL